MSQTKKPRIRKTIIEEPDWEEEKEKDEVIDQEDMEMERLAKSLPGGVRCIKLYRMHRGPRGGRPKFIAEIAPEQFSESFIQQTYGGGSYFGRWEKADGTMLRYTFDIAGPELNLDESNEPEDETPVYVAPAQTPTLDPLAVVKIMNDARREAREEFRMLLEMVKPAPQPPDATAQVFGLVEKIAPLIAQGSAESSGNPWLFALTTLKEPLTKLVDTINAAVTRPQPGTPSSSPVPSMPGSAPAAPVSPALKPEPKEHDMVIQFVKSLLPPLITAAAKNADPVAYADFVLDQVPESAYPQVRAWLVKPDCLEQLAALEPGIRFQHDWWVSLRAELLSALADGAHSLQPRQAGESTTGDPTVSTEPA